MLALPVATSSTTTSMPACSTVIPDKKKDFPVTSNSASSAVQTVGTDGGLLTTMQAETDSET